MSRPPDLVWRREHGASFGWVQSGKDHSLIARVDATGWFIWPEGEAADHIIGAGIQTGKEGERTAYVALRARDLVS